MRVKNKRVIVTGGPTREWLDPVRFISNPSTGKMGIALADESYRRGAETIFIHGPIQEYLINGKPYRTIGVESTEELLAAVLGALCDNSLLIMAAAPSDYAPVERSGVKIKKGAGEMALLLKKTPDILTAVSEKIKSGELKGMTVAGFAAETTNTEEYALGKLREKNLDMICLNDVSRKDSGFASDTNRVILFDRRGTRTALPTLTKAETAARILDFMEERF